MRIYLDDDLASPRLALRLRSAGHDVQMPTEIGMSGKDDSVHLAHAVRYNRVCLSRNYTDFENLHDLVIAVQGQHPGIIIVRQDNDPRRDLTHRGMVRALGKLLDANAPIQNQYIILNQWR